MDLLNFFRKTEEEKQQENNEEEKQQENNEEEKQQENNEEGRQHPFWGTAIIFIEKLRKKCKKLSSTYENESKKIRTRHIFTTLPIIFIGSVTTGLAYFSVGDNDSNNDDNDDDKEYIVTVVAILTSILTILGGISSLFSYLDRHSAHDVAASSYARLEHLIETTLVLPRDLRKHNEIAFTYISDEYSRLLTTSPTIYCC